ncbi:hypothetical protein lerEdw1_017529 [Lerista edwardsae]|nr:hypothetical protein lerEdw1_017529 [Lerista edwardsae]
MNTKATAAALLALFLFSGTLADDIPSARIGSELRCRCVSTYSQFIPSTQIRDVKLIPSGPHCKDVEVIATLKDDREVCLDPAAAWVKQITKAMYVVILSHS